MFDLKKYLKDNVNFSFKVKELLKKNRIAKKKDEIIFEVYNDYLNTKIKEEELTGQLTNKANLDIDIALDLAYDFVFELNDLLPDQVKKSLKKTTEAVISAEAKAKIELKDIIEKIKKIAGIEIEPRLAKRFAEIIYNWFRDIRDDSETLVVLTKSDKVGGMGLRSEKARALMIVLKNKEKDYLAQGVNILELITQELKKQEPVFEQEKVAEQEIDVASKPDKVQESKEKITGEDITIDKLLATQGVEFDKISPKETAVKEEEKTSPLAKEIEAKEKFLETKEELAPPAPAVQEPTQKKEEVELSIEDFIKPEPARPGQSQAKAEPVKETIKKDLKPSQQPAQLEPPLPVKPVQPPLQPVPLPLSPAQPKPAPAQEQPLPQRPTEVKPDDKQPLIRKSQDEIGSRPKVEDIKFATKLYGPIDELASFKTADFRRLSKDPQEAINKIKGKLDLLEDESLVQRIEGIKALKSSPLYKVYADIMNRAIMNGKSFEQILEEKKELSLEEFKAIMDLNKTLKY